MNELLAKGYGEEVSEDELDRDDGRVWYILHQAWVN